VSLHLQLFDRTRGILGAADLARMKKGAILVNTARAALVDEAALIEAAQSGRIFAALDVFSVEPLPADHPLTRAANTVLTPHLGYSALEVYEEYYRHSVENALAFLDGKPIRVLGVRGDRSLCLRQARGRQSVAERSCASSRRRSLDGLAADHACTADGHSISCPAAAAAGGDRRRADQRRDAESHRRDANS